MRAPRLASLLLLCACGSDATVPVGSSSTVTTGAGSAPSGLSTSSAGGAGGSGAGHTGGTGGAPLGPPYPIVLCHGFFGFEEFAGLDFATYFFGVKAELEARGELVYTPAVDPFNDSTYRGGQLIEHIEGILLETGHAKVNLIGHSQGGLDARVVAHDRPDLVASVVTVATPHLGTPIADIAIGVLDDPALADILAFLVDVVGAPLYDQVGDETDLIKPLELFSTPGITAFNAAYPDAQGVLYASITGRSDMHGGGAACNPGVPQAFITAFEDEKDPIDPLLSIPEAILDGGLLDPHPNDGLVRATDARWGEFWGCIPADHLDQVGHLFGDGPGLGNAWDHQAFYAALVAELRARGY